MVNLTMDEENGVESEFALELIRAVKETPCIWDFKLPEHHLRHKYHEAWRSVAEKLDMNPQLARDTWIRIKGRYKGCLYNMRKGRLKEPTYRYFDELSFLHIGRCSRTSRTPIAPKRSRVADDETSGGDLLFLLSLMPGMKRLPDDARLRLKVRMQAIVGDSLRQCGVALE